MLTLENLSLGCLKISNRTKFIRGEGFLYSGFRFGTETSYLPFNLTSYLYFSSQTASLDIVPSIDLGGKNWEVKLAMGGVWDSSSGYGFTELGISGFKLYLDEISGFEFGGAVALEGKLWQKKDGRALLSRASDYRVSPPVGEIARDYTYEKTNYEGVLTFSVPRSLATGTELSLSFDAYWNDGGEDGIFGVNFFTTEFDYIFGGKLGAFFAAEARVNRGIGRLEAGVRYFI